MSLNNIHNQLINHYRQSSIHKQNKNIKRQSIIKKTLLKKNIDSQKGALFTDFLKNEEKISAQSQPLSFRQLPRNLKVYFPGPPEIPPPLLQIPYTYEIIPKVPFKIPKQKKGVAAEWVVQESYFVQSNTKKSKQLHKKDRIQNNKSLDIGFRFRNAVKQLALKMRQQNLSLNQIISNKGFNKKPYNYYNSHQFFSFIKNGDKQAIHMLEENPYLAFDVDELKMTPLHWAARAGHAEIVNILTTKYRAQPLAKDSYGRTPLHLAVQKKNIEWGKLSSINNQHRSVRNVAPDVYTKFLLQKLQQIRFFIKAKGFKDPKKYKIQLEDQIKKSLDSNSLYF